MQLHEHHAGRPVLTAMVVRGRVLIRRSSGGTSGGPAIAEPNTPGGGQWGKTGWERTRAVFEASIPHVWFPAFPAAEDGGRFPVLEAPSVAVQRTAGESPTGSCTT